MYSLITHTRGSRLEYIFLSHIKHFILCAPCPILCSTHARALLLRLFRCSDLKNTATIHGSFSVALLRNHHVTGLLTTRRTCTSPKTIRSLNSRVVSSLCPTTSRFYFQPMAQRKASRRHRNRTSMTNKFVLCWLHHGIHWSEKQVRNDHKVYHSEREGLMSSSSQDPTVGGTGKPVAVFSSQSRSNQDTLSDRDPFS